MGIIRRGEHQYVYLSIRVGAGVTSRYLGRGDEAVRRLEAIKQCSRQRPAPCDPARFAVWYRRQVARESRELERSIRARYRAKFARLRARADRVEASVEGLASEARSLLRRAMTTAGYHQHDRTWRRKRGAAMADASELMELVVTPPEARGATTNAEGDLILRGAVRESLELQLKRSRTAAGGELLRREHARVLRELAGESPTPIERLLAERASICWLDCYLSDRVAIGIDLSLNFSPTEKDYFQRVRDRAHRRYVSTLKTLATVQARAVPAMKLSLAVRAGDDGPAAVAVVERRD